MKKALPMLFLLLVTSAFAQTTTTYYAKGGSVNSSNNEINDYLSPTGSFSTPYPDGFGSGCYYGGCPDWQFSNYKFAYVLPDGTTASFTNLTGSANFTNQYDVVTNATASGVDSSGALVSITVNWQWGAFCRRGCTKNFISGTLTVTKAVN